MIFRSILFLTAVLLASGAPAEPLPASRWHEAGNWLNTLCSYLDNGLRANEGSGNRYRWQDVIFHHAQVESGDSAEIRREKIQRLWKNEARFLTCNSPGFNVPGGSLAKFAVSKRSDAFIVHATRVWRLPLNDIDKADGRTLLDYVTDETERARRGGQSALANQLQTYIVLLKEAGAKHRFEIDGVDCRAGGGSTSHPPLCKRDP